MAPGLYTVAGYLDVAGEKADRSGLAVLVDPETTLKDGPANVVLDASKARLLQTQAPQRTEDRQRKVDFNVHYTGQDPYTDYRSAYVLPPTYDDVYVAPTEPMKHGEFVLTTRWRKGEPQLALSALGGRLRFDALMQPGSALGTATDSRDVVYAGNGAAAAYEKVKAKGKVVVLERSDEVAPQERAEAAVAAGAKALIVVNDSAGALMECVGESTIPVATAHRDAGKTLIAMAKSGIVKLTVKQTQYTPFVYDLTRDYPGQVPNRALVYKPTKSDLARIDARYYSATDGKLAEGYRSDFTLSPSFNIPESEWHPGTRTEWVTPGQVWREFHTQGVDGPLPWSMVSGDNTYTKGSTTRLNWFAPATRPGQSESFGVYNSRWQNYMTWNVQAWASASDNMRLGGYLPWGETPSHLQIFQGSTRIYDNPNSGDMQWEEVPGGNLPYRAVLDAERPGDVFRLSTRTHLVLVDRRGRGRSRSRNALAGRATCCADDARRGSEAVLFWSAGRRERLRPTRLRRRRSRRCRARCSSAPLDRAGVRGTGVPCLRHRPAEGVPVRVPELALEDLAGGVGGQDIEELHQAGVLVAVPLPNTSSVRVGVVFRGAAEARIGGDFHEPRYRPGT
ncbi:PA domain-containing protein [Streptomyces sp. NPDC056656]|uniref:PA domain-containing protein n=1 Tax=Streptomyces sp. NPDC056656 TaxID=3345895 RepID=UPI0036D174D9